LTTRVDWLKNGFRRIIEAFFVNWESREHPWPLQKVKIEP
jgi:hypothetical protein